MQGGWLSWVREDGSSFKNQGACVSYAARGGTLMLPQTITFTGGPPAHGQVGTTYTVSATGGGSGNPVLFTIDSASSSVCSIAGTVVTFNTLGACVIDASQSGGGVYLPAEEAQRQVTVDTKGDQTVAFGFGSQGTTYLAVAGISSDYTPSASATSGLPVQITVDQASAGCSLTAGVVTFTGDGICLIDANQPGNGNWNAAPQAQQSIQVYTPQSLVDLNQPTLTGIGQQGGDVPLDSNTAAAVSDALTIAQTLGPAEIGVGLMAQDLGRTFTPSPGGATARVDAINTELAGQESALEAIQATDPTTETLTQLQTQTSNLQAYAATLTQGFSDPGVPYTLTEVITVINAAVANVNALIASGSDCADTVCGEVSIGDMFGMQLLTSPTGALAELANGIVSADNQAIASMARNVTG